MRNLYVNHTLPNSFLVIGKDHKENGMIVEDRAQDPALVDLQGRTAPPSLPPGPLRTYGTIDCGLELMSQAWGSLQQEFSIGGCPLSPPKHFQLNGRPPLGLLNKHPVDLLITDDGSRAYVALGRANHVAVVDVKKREVIEYILVGKRAWGLALTADEKKLYVANGLSDDVTIIDTETLKPIASVPVGRVPYDILIDDR